MLKRVRSSREVGNGQMPCVEGHSAQPSAGIEQDLSAPPGTNALPNTGVGTDAVVLERGNNGGIYIGTDLGVFYTDNELFANGTGWQLLGENLPHVSCRGLEINYKANRLRAGTEGRGVWEHDLWCPSETDLLESGTYNADAFKEANNDISSTAMVPSGKDVSYRAGNEVHLLPGFHASSGSHFHAFIHPCDRAGNSFKSLPISGEQPSGSGNSTRSSTGTEMAVTPNPNQGRFTLHLPEGAAAVESMTLWNAQGRQFPVDPRGSGPTISVSLDVGIPSGMYMLRLHLADGSILHTKLIIQP